MLASQRRSVILELVEETGAVKVSELVERLGVSDMTIRRDIERLSSDGLLERVHGGALALGGSHSSEEPGFSAKSLLQLARSRRSPRPRPRVVVPGSAIGISAGTTTYESPGRQDVPAPDRRHQLGAGRPAAPRVGRARPDRRPHRRGAHALRRARRARRRRRPALAPRRPALPRRPRRRRPRPG